MNFFQRFLANQFLAFLQSTVKNPRSLAKERRILEEIRDNINQVLGGIDGTSN